jgi:tripartite-type tricarboxylate transporter receptor subunit TctC
MFNFIKRKAFLLLVCSLIAALVGCSDSSTSGESGETSASTDKGSYPNGTIELVVPASAGGDTDRNGRLLAKYLEDELGVSVVVQNVTGSSGSVGVQEILKSEPDGHRVLFFHNNILINNILGLTENKYSDLKIAGISAIDRGNGVIVGADSPYENLNDLMEAAKDDPKGLNLGTSVGSFTHFQMLDVSEKAGVEFNLVDTGDFAERIAAVMGGQLDLVPMQLGLVKDYIDSGEMKALGVLSEERLEQFPDVPTFKELGIDSTFEKFFFVAFPKETPDEVVDVFTKAVEKVTQNEEYIEMATGYGIEPEYMNPEEAEQLMSERDESYSKIYEGQQ